MIGEIIKMWSIESVKIPYNEELFIGFILQKTKEITSMYGIEIGASSMLSTSDSDRMLKLIQTNGKFKDIIIWVHDTLNKINQTCLARVASDVLTIE